ncbi:MAG: hypothetical protein KDE54_13735, partial [Caldilineaceae bacterium]|nr:hypothetical protein [Caldilineaceae bacterium]
MTISVRMFNFIGSRTWRRVSLALLLAWTVAVMSALSAQAAPAAAPAQQVGAPVTIDFNNMSSSIVPSTYSGSQEDGYTIIPGGTVKKYRQAFPTPPFNGTILIGNGSGSTLTITRQDAGSFQFKQLDGQCSGCISAGTSLDVQGFLGNTLVGTDSYPLFLHESNPATFAAVNLAGKTIDRLVVNFHNVTGRASTDNIVLGPPAGGTIIINKRTVPAGGTGFGFTDNIAAPNTFTLDDNGSKSFLNVPAGSYTVTEDAVADTFLSSLRCDDDASATPSAVNIVTRTATIKLDAGETVTCTFTNSADDVIIIEKVTWPAGGAGFAFSSDIPGSATFTLDD